MNNGKIRQLEHNKFHIAENATQAEIDVERKRYETIDNEKKNGKNCRFAIWQLLDDVVSVGIVGPYYTSTVLRPTDFFLSLSLQFIDFIGIEQQLLNVS